MSKHAMLVFVFFIFFVPFHSQAQVFEISPSEHSEVLSNFDPSSIPYVQFKSTTNHLSSDTIPMIWKIIEFEKPEAWFVSISDRNLDIAISNQILTNGGSTGFSTDYFPGEDPQVFNLTFHNQNTNGCGSVQMEIINDMTGEIYDTLSYDVEINTCDLTSNDNISKELDFAVYPNPTTGIITLPLKDLYEIEVLDTQGRKILELAEAQYTEIDLSSFENGLYFIHLKSTGKLIGVTKIIKQ